MPSLTSVFGSVLDSMHGDYTGESLSHRSHHRPDVPDALDRHLVLRPRRHHVRRKGRNELRHLGQELHLDRAAYPLQQAVSRVHRHDLRLHIDLPPCQGPGGHCGGRLAEQRQADGTLRTSSTPPSC